MTNENSLVGKLQILQDFDDGASDLSIEKITEIVQELKDFKIDSCADFLDALDSRIEFWDAQKKKADEAKSSLETSKENFRKYLNYALESTNTDKITGTRYTLSRQTRTTIKPLKFEVTARHFMDFAKIHPGAIEHAYKINASEFKKALEKNEDLKKEYSTTETSSFVTFRANTKPKKKEATND